MSIFVTLISLIEDPAAAEEARSLLGEEAIVKLETLLAAHFSYTVAPGEVFIHRRNSAEPPASEPPLP